MSNEETTLPVSADDIDDKIINSNESVKDLTYLFNENLIK